jgi:Uma2 family endonuclease
MKAASAITTAEQLLAAGDIGRCELVHGELVMMPPAGFDHGRIASNLTLLLGGFVREKKLGVITAAETGFIISRNPDTVRAPDVGLVRKERLADAPGKGFFPGPPDVAVEVLSPDDSAADVLAKVHDWLAAGTSQVWLVDPRHRTISIHRRRGGEESVRTFGEQETITATDPLAGFSLKVADVFT